MTVTTRSLRATFALWVSFGLLAAAIPCAWVCSITAATSAATAATAEAAPGATADAAPSEHCARRATTTPAPPGVPAQRDTPCEEDCPGCDQDQVSIPATALALDATSAPASLWVPASHVHATASLPRAPALRAGQWAGDLPPPDILALKATLLI